MKVSNYLKDISILSAGTFISQIILLIFIPIIAVIYSPAQFGVSAFFIALGSILSALATGKYDFAVFSSNEESTSIQFFFGSIFINLISSSLLIIFCLIISPFFDEYFHFFATVALIFLNGLNLSFTSWFNKAKDYKIIAIFRGCKNLFIGIFTIFFGLKFGDYSICIIFANILGLSILLIVYLIYFLIKYSSLKKYLILSHIYKLLLSDFSYPLYSVPASIVNVLSSQSPVIILKFLFGDSIAGIYALVNRVLGAPVDLISTSTGEVFRQKASKYYNQRKKCTQLFSKTFTTLFKTALAPFFVIALFGPMIFSFFLGDDWEQAGYFSRYLSIFFLLRFSISPLSFVLIIAKKQKYNLQWQLSLLFITSLSLLLGYKQSNPDLSVVLYSFAYSIMYLIYYFKIKKTIEFDFKK